MTRFSKASASGLAVCALAATATLAAPSLAQAEPTGHTSSDPSAVDFIGDSANFTLLEAGQTTTCAQFDLHGEAFDQPGPGEPLAEFNAFTVDGCANPIVGAAPVEPSGVWALWITGAEIGSTSAATLSDVEFAAGPSDCSFTVSGSVTGQYDDSIGVFTPTSSSLIIADDPVGFTCSILGVARGQAVALSGSWQSNPPITVPSP